MAATQRACPLMERKEVERRIALDPLDFRLLNAFVAIDRERHVGRAADALGMSQPTVSTLLARLRQAAGDPLFIRSAQGMQPTALARAWAEPVASALAALESALNTAQRCSKCKFQIADCGRDCGCFQDPGLPAMRHA